MMDATVRNWRRAINTASGWSDGGTDSPTAQTPKIAESLARSNALRQHTRMRPLLNLRAPATIVTTWRSRLEVLREYHDELFALGVTPGQARILLYIEEHPRCYLQQCARSLGLTSRTVGYPVRLLEQKRWVVKRRAPQDDRYVSLTLTRNGQALVRKIHKRLKPVLKAAS